MKRALLIAAVALVGSASSTAVAEEAPKPARATFALIVGANQSVDTNLAPLKYADDDAARYLDLFRLLGARTYLLTRPDENTRRLHPQAAAEAEAPNRAALERTLTTLSADVTQAAARNIDTVVYVVYAGHGNVKGGQGYITLEDSRITGAELAQMMGTIPAKRIHVIVDACASYFLAYSRGPGGERRPLRGFRASALTDDARVGVLLSTSSARESHEWDAFQSGVFSHEVRSGLYGAADADGDGEVTYREIAAFVARANAAIPNERYRPEVYARAPASGETLLDIKSGLRRKLVIDGSRTGHYFLEDARGVRLADVHNGPGQTLSLFRPSPAIPLYLRRGDEREEFSLDASSDVIALADLSPSEPRARSRGAAHESFSLIFSQPFDRAAVEGYRPADPPSDDSARAEADESAAADAAAAARLRRTLGFVGIGLGGVGLATGIGFSISGRDAQKSSDPGESQASAAARNERIAFDNTAAAVSYVAGGVLAVTGLALVLWPESRPRAPAVSNARVRFTAAPAGRAGGVVGVDGAF